MRSDTIICSGYSKFPVGMAATNLFGVMGVGMEIDPTPCCVVNASSTFVTNMCTDFIKGILVGHNLHEGNDAPIDAFEHRYLGLGKKAIVAAIRDAYNQFEVYKSGVSEANYHRPPTLHPLSMARPDGTRSEMWRDGRMTKAYSVQMTSVQMTCNPVTCLTWLHDGHRRATHLHDCSSPTILDHPIG